MTDFTVQLPSFRTSLSVFFLLILLNACEESGNKEAQGSFAGENEKRNGLKKSYYSKNKIKTAVNYKEGEKHGMSTSYYENGNKQLEMPYNMGVREGISKKYYEKGILYAETPYVNNEIEGMRKTYFTNGRLKAETPYKYSLMGTGTKEYGTNGKPLSGYTMSAKEVDYQIFEVSLDRKCKKLIFYEGELIDGQYLDESRVVPLPMNGDIGVYNNTKDFKQELNFICKCNTMGGNVAIANVSLSLK